MSTAERTGPVAADLDATQTYLARSKDAIALAQVANDPETVEEIRRISLAWMDLAVRSGGEVVAEIFRASTSNDHEPV